MIRTCGFSLKKKIILKNKIKSIYGSDKGYCITKKNDFIQDEWVKNDRALEEDQK